MVPGSEVGEFSRALQSTHRRTNSFATSTAGTVAFPQMIPGLYFYHASPYISLPNERWNFPLDFVGRLRLREVR